MELLTEVLRQCAGQLFRCSGDSQIACLRHRQAGVAAGIDRVKRRQIHVDVQADTMVAAAFAHAQTERSDLGDSTFTFDIHAGRAVQSGCRHAIFVEQVDDRLFNAVDEFADLEVAPCEIEQQIDDDLAGALVSIQEELLLFQTIKKFLTLHHSNFQQKMQLLNGVQHTSTTMLSTNVF